MKKNQWRKGVLLLLGILALVAVLCGVPSLGQVSRNTSGVAAGRRTSSPEKSRADLAADELVSLSADTLVGILRNEPAMS